MADDLGLDSGKYSITLVVFFIGYVLCEVPSKYEIPLSTFSEILLTRNSMVLARSRPSIFLPTIMFTWGCVTIGMAWVKDYKDLLAFRVVIGCLEAGFAPGVLLLLSSWYKKAEQSKRFAVYISAAILSGAFGGLIAGAIEEGLDGKYGLEGWRWLFIVEGAMTAGWSLIASFILLDFPANSKRLTDRERELAILRIQSESMSVRTEDTPELGHLKALGLALRNWRVWVLTVGYMVRLQVMKYNVWRLTNDRSLLAPAPCLTSTRRSSKGSVTAPKMPSS
jgi:MFS family permease